MKPLHASTDTADSVAEAHYWRNVAIYLADCHAATAFEYEAKSASKSCRNRMIAIMETCIAAMNKHPNKCGKHPRSVKDVTDRCMKTITALHAANAR